jgi:hypothetical protein
MTLISEKDYLQAIRDPSWFITRAQFVLELILDSAESPQYDHPAKWYLAPNLNSGESEGDRYRQALERCWKYLRPLDYERRYSYHDRLTRIAHQYDELLPYAVTMAAYNAWATDPSHSPFVPSIEIRLMHPGWTYELDTLYHSGAAREQGGEFILPDEWRKIPLQPQTHHRWSTERYAFAVHLSGHSEAPMPYESRRRFFLNLSIRASERLLTSRQVSSSTGRDRKACGPSRDYLPSLAHRSPEREHHTLQCRGPEGARVSSAIKRECYDMGACVTYVRHA